MVFFGLNLMTRSNEDSHMGGVTKPGRIAFNVVSIICVITTGVLFGIRVRHFNMRSISSIGAVRTLTALVYVTAMFLLASLLLIVDAFDISQKINCKSTIINCLVFYILNKGCLYLFLVERVHAARASHATRLHDWVWLTGMTFITIGFIIVAVFCFMFPYSSVTHQGICLIGIGRVYIFILWAADMFINVGLTGIFFFLLLPTLRFRRQYQANLLASSLTPDYTQDPDSVPWKEPSALENTIRVDSSATMSSAPATFPKASDPLAKLLRKTVIGTVGQLIATLVNMIVIMVHGGHEQATTCLILCALEVTTQVGILHWLTNTLKSEDRS